jgi:hypothetical protein
MRVTNWLAGWLDYVCATVLTAGRWLRVPTSRDAEEPVMMAAFAPTMDSYGPRWHDADADDPGSGRIVRVLEILMLSISFFLAAHLLSGGTPTVSAPNVAFGFSGSRTQAAALAVPAEPGRQVHVDAGSFLPAAPAPTVQPVEQAPAAADTPAAEQAAVLAPASGADTHTAAVDAPGPNAAPPAATAVEPPPAPAAAVVEPPPPAVTSTGVPAEADRYLTIEEFRSAALAAGWSEAQLPALEVVARCESHFRTGAFHLGARGLMQVLPNWFAFAGLDAALWYDPVTNLTAALAAYNEHTRFSGDGWSGWTCQP